METLPAPGARENPSYFQLPHFAIGAGVVRAWLAPQKPMISFSSRTMDVTWGDGRATTARLRNE